MQIFKLIWGNKILMPLKSTKRDDRNHKIITFLSVIVVILGTIQIAGFVLRNGKIFYIGKATAIAPLPRPFVDIHGYENFASNVSYDIKMRNGSVVTKKINSSVLMELKGPHKRKIVYINAIVFSPVVKKYRYDSILNYAFCNNGPLLKMFHVEGDVKEVVVHIKTMTAGRKDYWKIPVVCK